MKFSTTGKWVYGLSQALTLMLIVLVTGIITLAGWLMLEPREIPELTTAIEKSLNRSNRPYHLNIDQTILALGDFRHPLEVIIREVELRNKAGESTVKIPSMHVALDIWSLLMGKIRPATVALNEPSIAVFQDVDGVFYLSSQQNPQGYRTTRFIRRYEHRHFRHWQKTRRVIFPQNGGTEFIGGEVELRERGQPD